jgi:hypothetical protein
MLSDQQAGGAPDIEIRNPSPRPIGAPYHAIMPTLDLTDDEKLAPVAHLRHALEYDPFPYAPRLDPAKCDPGEARTVGATAGTVAADQGW